MGDFFQLDEDDFKYLVRWIGGSVLTILLLFALLVYLKCG